MISVIILSRNFKYVVLDVPLSGKLIIMEKHIIAGMVQNGVKVIPYGTVLNSFETYLQGETLMSELIPHNAFEEEGRILDFTIIELLQVSTSIPLGSSGSVIPFVPPVYYSNGYPVIYNLKLKGINPKTLEECNSTIFPPQTVVNAFAYDSEGSLLLSIPVLKNSLNVSGQLSLLIGQYGISYIEDLGGIVTELTANAFQNNSGIVNMILPELLKIGGGCFYGAHELKELFVPKLQTLGNSVGDDQTFYQVNHQWSRVQPADYSSPVITLPRYHETSNAGAVDGDLLYLNGASWLNAPTIVYID